VIQRGDGSRKPPRRGGQQQSIKVNDLKEKEGKEEIPPVKLSEGEPTESRNMEDESAEESLTSEDQDQPEWTPDTRYLRHKITKETNKPVGSMDNIPYALRSRTPKGQAIGRPRDLNTMPLQSSRDSEELPRNILEGLNVDSNTHRTHSYNLRSRTRTS
jgi:hypothetical protein